MGVGSGCQQSPRGGELERGTGSVAKPRRTVALAPRAAPHLFVALATVLAAEAPQAAGAVPAVGWHEVEAGTEVGGMVGCGTDAGCAL